MLPTLEWITKNSTLPNSNLPILYTLPSGKIAEAYIAKHTHYIQVQKNVYLVHEEEVNLYWDKSLILNEYINQTQDEAIIPTNQNKLSILQHSKNTSMHLVQPPSNEGLLDI